MGVCVFCDPALSPSTLSSCSPCPSWTCDHRQPRRQDLYPSLPCCCLIAGSPGSLGSAQCPQRPVLCLYSCSMMVSPGGQSALGPPMEVLGVFAEPHLPRKEVGVPLFSSSSSGTRFNFLASVFSIGSVVLSPRPCFGLPPTPESLMLCLSPLGCQQGAKGLSVAFRWRCLGRCWLPPAQHAPHRAG